MSTPGFLNLHAIPAKTGVQLSADSISIVFASDAPGQPFTSTQLPATLGQKAMAASLAVVIASDQSAVPISGTVTATNPSVGATGAAVPASGTYIGMTVGGNLTGLTGTANGLKVDGSAVTQPVSGTFWQATQPVSAASLPLPAGAATAAKQPALGTAGAASADVITIQGIAAMTALKVDGSAVTQPISAASLPLPTGAALDASVTAMSAKLPATLGQKAMAASLSVAIASDQSGVPVTGTFWQATQPVSGTVTANAGSGTFTTDQTTAAATFQAEGSILGTALTGAYATVFTTGGVMKLLYLRNSCNQPVVVSLDGGVTGHFILEIGETLSMDLKSLGLNVANGTVIQAKHNGVTPTSGSIRVNGAR